jgi:cytochrome b6-f complex iron-sulfur subunit
LLTFGKFAFTAMATSAIVDSCASKTPTAPKTSGQTITLDLTDAKYSGLATVGASINVPDPNHSSRPIIVHRESDTVVVALPSSCTFDGCQLPFLSSGAMTCPCCGSKFDKNGKVIQGPATTNLTAYAATLTGTVVTINA